MNKVVGENSYRLDFTYDSNNQLVGLTTEEDNYFYIRDITNNIVGLIDTNGEYVIKYEYDACGNILKVEKYVPSCIAANHNPFKYKWYYYDDEAGLAMVGQRYYNPNWKRWLSPDDIAYLDLCSLNAINLYVYLGVGALNINASVGAGVSRTVGIQFGDSVSVSAKGYVGIGFTLDFTNGIKFGAGLGLGYEISLNIDWYELFH